MPRHRRLPRQKRQPRRRRNPVHSRNQVRNNRPRSSPLRRQHLTKARAEEARPPHQRRREVGAAEGVEEVSLVRQLRLEPIS